MREQAPRTTFLVDAADYLKLAAQVDETKIREAFIGVWPSREDFGRQLLEENNAEKRLQSLPLWLRQYVRLDGEAIVKDLERDGVYALAEISRGVCVFDGPIIHKLQE